MNYIEEAKKYYATQPYLAYAYLSHSAEGEEKETLMKTWGISDCSRAAYQGAFIKEPLKARKRELKQSQLVMEILDTPTSRIQRDIYQTTLENNKKGAHYHWIILIPHLFIWGLFVYALIKFINK